MHSDAARRHEASFARLRFERRHYREIVVILEAAILTVRAGEQRAFKAAMAEARPLIAAWPGFPKVELPPGVVS